MIDLNKEEIKYFLSILHSLPQNTEYEYLIKCIDMYKKRALVTHMYVRGEEQNFFLSFSDVD